LGGSRGVVGGRRKGSGMGGYDDVVSLFLDPVLLVALASIAVSAFSFLSFWLRGGVRFGALLVWRVVY
jgi:hypothetical protein